MVVGTTSRRRLDESMSGSVGELIIERNHSVMAKQVFVELVDDIDGAPIKSGKGETIGFSVDGVEYEIDLGVKNAKEFRKQLDYWAEHATKVSSRGKKATAKKATGTATQAGSSPRDPLQTKAIREWANQNGYTVSSRGRIPAEVEEAYNSAQ